MHEDIIRELNELFDKNQNQVFSSMKKNSQNNMENNRKKKEACEGFDAIR